MTSPEKENDSKNCFIGADEQVHQNMVSEEKILEERGELTEVTQKSDQSSICNGFSQNAIPTKNDSVLLNQSISLPKENFHISTNNYKEALSEDLKSSIGVNDNVNELGENQVMLDLITNEIISGAVTDANQIISQRTNVTNEDLNSFDEIRTISEKRTHLNDTSLPSEHSATILEKGAIESDIVPSAGMSNIPTCSESNRILKNENVIAHEPASRDFPLLPLVDNLFTINIIDNIIHDALNEIKQNQNDEVGRSGKEQSENPCSFSNTLSLRNNIDGPSNLSDAPCLLVNEEECLDSIFMPSQTIDTVGASLLVSEVPLNGTVNAPLVAQQIIPITASPQENNASDDVHEENNEFNDWSKCNGFLGDDEDFPNGFSSTGERELVTEIIYVSETSFMDEAALAAAAMEEAESPSVQLNPDAPVFVPMSPTERNSNTSSDPFCRELSRTDECTSRFSDFDDRVDISDYEDDGPKSTPSSISQTYIPTDDELSCSYQQPAEIDKDKKKKLALNNSVSNEEASLGADSTLEKDQIDEIQDEIKQIKSIADSLFHQLQENEEQHSPKENQADGLQDLKTGSHYAEKTSDDILSTLICNSSDKLNAIQADTDESKLISVNLDDIDISNVYGNENTQIEEFEEYVGEKYMDHQQIYDPVKYKDYYQICSDVDVPDSPLDMMVKNVTPSRSLSDSSTSQTYKPKGDAVPNESETKASNEKASTDDIPEVLKGRVSEIVLHEVDDVSECGSEDIETIGHRYESSEGQKHIYVNQLSLAAELLRTKQHLPYDSEFKPLVPGTDAGETAHASSVASLQGTALAGPRSSRKIYEKYYGNPCFEMETMEVPTRKEISDSGVQSEESADEADDAVKKGGDNSPEKGEFTYKSFGTKRPKPMSAMLKGKSDPLCLCCEIM